MLCSYIESKHPKIFPIGQPPNKYSKFLLLSLQSFVTKRCMWLCKNIGKKKRRKKYEKIDKCPRE
jgi:hypothetical protein